MTCICAMRAVPELKQLAEKRVTSLELNEQPCMVDYINFNKLKNFNMGELLRSIKSKQHKDSVDGNESEKSNKMSADASGCDEASVFSAMRYESNRLKSYHNKWTVQYVKPADLAAAGLFYLGFGDCVQCAFCHGVINGWNVGDVPLKEHAQHFPMCPYLLGSDVGNVSIGGVNALKKWEIYNSYPECVSSCESRPSGGYGSATHRTLVPKYPSKNNVDVRLKTFSGWLSPFGLRPEQMAECGLFYTGVSDIVTCFCCGGSLGNWEFGDDPWVEHAKHFPGCAYVKFIKGSSFIESVKTSEKKLPMDCVQSEVPSTGACNSSTSEFLQKEMSEKCEETGSCSNIVKSHCGKQQNKYLCKICMDEGPRVAFLPCGHSLACPRCAEALTVCPLCRKSIQNRVRIYFD